MPGVEAGVQLAERWALTWLADYGYVAVGDRAGHARRRADLVVVPAWWLDVAIHGGTFLDPRGSLHADPLLGLTVTGRW